MESQVKQNQEFIMQINYRSANLRDFIEIARLDRICWNDAEFPEYMPDGDHVWRLWVEYAVVECAFDGDVMIGANVSFPTNQDRLYFNHKLFVHEEYRGLGIAKQLLMNRLKRTDELGVATMYTTSKKNKTMQHIGEKLGYKKVDFIEGYYRPEEDRYLLRREAGNLHKE